MKKFQSNIGYFRTKKWGRKKFQIFCSHWLTVQNSQRESRKSFVIKMLPFHYKKWWYVLNCSRRIWRGLKVWTFGFRYNKLQQIFNQSNAATTITQFWQSDLGSHLPSSSLQNFSKTAKDSSGFRKSPSETNQ